MTNPTRLAEMVRTYLHLHKITQKELADAIGSTQGRISRFIAGKNDLEAIEMVQLLNWLMDEAND